MGGTFLLPLPCRRYLRFRGVSSDRNEKSGVIEVVLSYSCLLQPVHKASINLLHLVQSWAHHLSSCQVFSTSSPPPQSFSTCRAVCLFSFSRVKCNIRQPSYSYSLEEHVPAISTFFSSPHFVNALPVQFLQVHSVMLLPLFTPLYFPASCSWQMHRFVCADMS